MELKSRLKYFFIRKLSWLLINGIMATCKIKIKGSELIEELREKGTPIIYAYWHRHIFFNVYRFKGTGARPLISLSNDGELVAQIALEFGMNPVRGSSSRGGARAFIELLNSLKDERSEILITADGPKGPLRQVKDGTIVLAQKTGSVIVPICWTANRMKIFEKTWDKFIIPLPFSTITFVYAPPLFIPPRVTKEGIGDLSSKLKAAIDTLELELKKKPPS